MKPSVDEEKIKTLEDKSDELTNLMKDVQVSQKQHSQQLKATSSRLEVVEKRQDEVIRLLTGLRTEMAGLSSGMARRDSLILGGTLGPGLTTIRRDSLILAEPQDGINSRRESLVLGGETWQPGRSGSITVMEVEPWDPPHEVQKVLDRLLERQFLLSPWVREKRLRNQLRLVLKDHLEAGPQRRSTVTKIVHDAHQLFPTWRNQIREKMFDSWDLVQVDLKAAEEVIFGQFKKPRFPDEIEMTVLYTEHMVEVGQFLSRKALEKLERSGKTVTAEMRTANPKQNVTNSRFWYEVRKKINEILDQRQNTTKEAAEKEDKSDSEGSVKGEHVRVTSQSSVDTEGDDQDDVGN